MTRILRVCLVVVALAGCTNDSVSADERAWAERLTGAVAQVNDVVALELVPAISGQSIDFAAVKAACDRLPATVAGVEKASENPPAKYESVASTAERLSEELRVIAAGCSSVALTHDPAAFRLLGERFYTAASLEDAIAKALPSDVKCDDATQAMSHTCQASD